MGLLVKILRFQALYGNFWRLVSTCLLLEKMFSGSASFVHFSRAEVSSKLNGLVEKDCVTNVRKQKYFQCADMVFPFFCLLVDKSSDYGAMKILHK